MKTGDLLDLRICAVVFAATLGSVSCAPYHGAPHVYAPAYREYPHHYHYYPSTGVYFHLYTGYYYYHSDGHWVRTKKLPPRLYLSDRDRVRIWSDAYRPYYRYDTHRKKYPPRPSYHSDPHRNSAERSYNLRRYEEYHKKYGR